MKTVNEIVHNFVYSLNQDDTVIIAKALERATGESLNYDFEKWSRIEFSYYYEKLQQDCITFLNYLLAT